MIKQEQKHSLIHKIVVEGDNICKFLNPTLAHSKHSVNELC